MLNALRTKLVDPELFAHFCAVFTQEMNRLRMEGRAGIAGAEAEMAKLIEKRAGRETGSNGRGGHDIHDALSSFQHFKDY